MFTDLFPVKVRSRDHIYPQSRILRRDDEVRVITDLDGEPRVVLWGNVANLSQPGLKRWEVEVEIPQGEDDAGVLHTDGDTFHVIKQGGCGCMSGGPTLDSYDAEEVFEWPLPQ